VITFRTPTVPDIAHIANNLRRGDYEEIEALGEKPFEAIMDGYLYGQTKVACLDKPICIFGVTDHGPAGQIWMLGTDDIRKVPVEFCKKSKQIVDEYQQQYEVLWNIIDCRNTGNIAWLKWLGFEFGDPFNHGPAGYQFMEFSRCR
tara:strand:+ start:403 stop:840 length:438 start_codon:yes stop_codon:yes gene_type:complete